MTKRKNVRLNTPKINLLRADESVYNRFDIHIIWKAKSSKTLSANTAEMDHNRIDIINDNQENNLYTNIPPLNIER